MHMKRPQLLISNGVHANWGGGQMLDSEVKGGERGTALLKAPFPRQSYPGGKSRIAADVWARIGDCDNYIEPFAGSLAMLLKRPADHFANGYRVETVNDANHYIVNFWRAVKSDPDAVAEWCDSPVIEADLHARHKWLVQSTRAKEWKAKMAEDPEYFDAKIAGWWVWGQCCWIGGAWCTHKVDQNVMPLLDQSQKGVVSNCGNHACGRPQLTDAFDVGRGVHASAKMPRLTGGRTGDSYYRRDWLTGWMRRLSDRLRLVRTCYGHWSRICDSDSTMTRLDKGRGVGVFLDPPYPANRGDNGKKSRDDSLYINDKTQDLNALRDEVLAWCRKWEGPQVRIAVCGYEGDGYESLIAEGWIEQAWEAGGGYANQRRGGKGKAENAKRERVWYSPACLKPENSAGLFDEVAA